MTEGKHGDIVRQRKAQRQQVGDTQTTQTGRNDELKCAAAGFSASAFRLKAKTPEFFSFSFFFTIKTFYSKTVTTRAGSPEAVRVILLSGWVCISCPDANLFGPRFWEVFFPIRM